MKRMEQSRNSSSSSLFATASAQSVLLIALIVGSFMLGSLWTKVQILESGGGAKTTSPEAATQQTQQTTGQTTQQTPGSTITLDQIKALFDKKLIAFGDKEKKVLFVEVGDPSCPYCHVAAGKNPELNAQVGDRFKLVSSGGSYVAPVPEIKKLVDSGKASFVYIYTPGHGNGDMGMKALYCAHEKGKFWQVHDFLMTNAGYSELNNTIKNDKSKSGELATFLKSVFNETDMKTCLDSGKYETRLADDSALAKSLGVQGTPGFFVNATPFPGAYSFKDMESVVTSALK